MRKNIIVVFCFFTFLVRAQEFKTGKIDETWFEKLLTNEQKEYPAVFLEKYRRTHFEYRDDLDGWTLFTTVHNVVKILDEDGLDYATHKIRVYQQGRDDQKIDRIEAFSYKMAGGKVEKQKLRGSNIIVNNINKNVSETIIPVPSVEVGSIVEYSYRIESTFYTIRDLIIQEDIPVKHLYAKIEIPQFFDYNKYINGYLPVEPKISIEKRNENFSYEAKNSLGVKVANRTDFASISFSETVAEYEFNDVPPLVNEPMVNYMGNYRSLVSYELGAVEFQRGKRVDRSKTWDQVAVFFFDNLKIKEQLENNKFLDKEVLNIKKMSKSNSEKVRLAYEAIQNKMTVEKKSFFS